MPTTREDYSVKKKGLLVGILVLKEWHDATTYLQRSSCDQHPKLGMHCADTYRQGGVLILDTMCLINDKILPVNLEELALFFQDTFVRRDENVELVLSGGWVRREFFSDDLEAFFLGPTHTNSTNAWAPVLELFNPITNYGLWDDDNVRSLNTTRFPKIGEERYRLESLSKTLR
jgi:hypothetical protein